MAEYHVFPPARPSEITRYNSRPLPRIPSDHPSQVYFTKESSASYESILDHRIPSSTFDQEEIHQIWSRASQQSFSSNAVPSLTTALTRTDSLTTISDYTRSSRRRSSARLPTLLPPALEYQYNDRSVQGVPCRLSSASTKDLGFSLSPVAAKRSATPDLLHKLSTDLEGLSFADRAAEASFTSTTPTTPDEIFSTSLEFNSPIYKSNNCSVHSSSTTLDMADTSPPTSPKTLVRKGKPSSILTSTRKISSPMPSPHCVSSHSPLLRLNTHDSAVDPSYHPVRPAPLAPSAPIKLPATEVSCMEWDDDDLASKLARVKKSIGDLRAAAIRTPKTAPKERKVEKATVVNEQSASPTVGRPRAQRSMTAPTQIINVQQPQSSQQIPTRPCLPRTTSSGGVRTSLPVLPTRNYSVRGAAVSARPSHEDSHATSGQSPATQKISRKVSVRVATAAGASTPTRKRATSDAPVTQNLSLFPYTPATSPSSRQSKVSSGSAATPSSSPRSINTALTTVSNGTTAVGSLRSRQSSVASMALKEKPLPNPHAGASGKPSKRRGVKPALGNKRFSVLSFASVRSSAPKQKAVKISASATQRNRVIGFGKLRRWWRWVSRCSTIPVVTSAGSDAKLRSRKVSSPVTSSESRTELCA